MAEPELDAETLTGLLHKAHAVVTWTTQDTLKRDAAGIRHLIKARQDYLKARIDAFAAIRPLTSRDSEGCTCGSHPPDFVNCMYHYAAKLQPDNHRIPWNCPTYYDGCNCDDGARSVRLVPVDEADDNWDPKEDADADKTCTHCGGSGKEPDALADAWVALGEEISRGAGHQHLMIMAARVQELSQARVTFLEAALRDVLSHARENGAGNVTMFAIEHETASKWRAILDGTPGQADQ